MNSMNGLWLSQILSVQPVSHAFQIAGAGWVMVSEAWKIVFILFPRGLYRLHRWILKSCMKFSNINLVLKRDYWTTKHPVVSTKATVNSKYLLIFPPVVIRGWRIEWNLLWRSQRDIWKYHHTLFTCLNFYFFLTSPPSRASLNWCELAESWLYEIQWSLDQTNFTDHAPISYIITILRVYYKHSVGGKTHMVVSLGCIDGVILLCWMYKLQ